MPATYDVLVRCCNCGDERIMSIDYGTEVDQTYCFLCGCKSLVRLTISKKDET